MAETLRRWRRAEYDRLVDLGMFVGERIELLDGALVVREPQGSKHAAIVAHIGQVLGVAFGTGWHPRLHAPLALDDASEPEPDIAIVIGSPLDYVGEHPSTAVLLVEVADSSLRTDRRLKAGLYARTGIAEYWIVNLTDAALEIHRDPEAGGYRTILRVTAPATVTPLAAPRVTIPVSDLLPSRRRGT
jgi:Uma2 family endonuclease